MPKQYVDIVPEQQAVAASVAEEVRAPEAPQPGDGSLLVSMVGVIAEQLAKAQHGRPRVLVMAQGKMARRSLAAIRETGVWTVVPQAGDWRLDINPKLADEAARLGQKPLRQLFYNAYAVLQAAQEAQVCAVFLDGPCAFLASDNRFLSRAAEAGIGVFAAFEDDVTRQYWTERVPAAADVPGAPQPTWWRTCHSCKLTFDDAQFVANDYHCPHCGTLDRMGSRERIDLILDDGVFEEWDADLPDADPLSFPGYGEKVAAQRAKTGLHEAVVCGFGHIGRVPCAFGCMDSGFFMGSMGSFVGEKLARLFDRATEQGLPVVVFCASGGARMQEGLASLMQMAKVSCAIERHSRAGLLFISVLTDPTTGGVTASFATLGDVILAEPKTLIGFAGQRVIRDTIKQELPEGFQTAEFALQHGLIDAIVERTEMRRAIKTLLRLHCGTPPHPEEEADEVLKAGAQAPLSEKDRRKLERHAQRELRRAGLKGAPEPGSAWERVQLARNVHRPTALTYISGITESFFELHGDRAFADDEAIVAGVGMVGGQPVTIIAQEKGSNLNDRIRRNFGCPMPEGYRKSARLMQQAQKFGRPIVCLVDTQGAFCGTEAEERGQGNAIAENLKLMAGLTVPVVSVLLGEGGSGGALALAVSNRVAMQENAVYSILSPEGFASILWKDGKRAPEAAEVMQMDAARVFELGFVDEVLSEGEGPAHENPEEAVENVLAYLEEALVEMAPLSPEELVTQRQARFAQF
ncbi:acetyl-CoA carboxylase carboxyltransferase subunit alpha [Parvibacter caecicola]|uniref:Multifunctional fusion protein n=1 Tax=Parvibacter caecicola TaxID=747645 RepID=A0A7W5D188_9ACTN|nr:acetyl-CoA carboxylase carboxyltransferase subunit alpha [Parvibacter caecicola]MBB3171053.1 acetyl-CoA carboxylase carboxyl transferase subunit beta [Parvibacter caecicola]MCR2042153.1 acetyl-CoA carboxylase carboxyltransferase subunit alpha [Parvibacter caecicola]